MFALGGWWYARHSTVLGSAQFFPAKLAGSDTWRVLLLSGTDAALAGANGEVGTVTVHPWEAGDLKEVL